MVSVGDLDLVLLHLNLFLTAQIITQFPWYNDLNSILGSNPALAATTVSSRPGANHAASFFSLTRPATGPHHTLSTRHSVSANVPPSGSSGQPATTPDSHWQHAPQPASAPYAQPTASDESQYYNAPYQHHHLGSPPRPLPQSQRYYTGAATLQPESPQAGYYPAASGFATTAPYSVSSAAVHTVTRSAMNGPTATAGSSGSTYNYTDDYNMTQDYPGPRVDDWVRGVEPDYGPEPDLSQGHDAQAGGQPFVYDLNSPPRVTASGSKRPQPSSPSPPRASPIRPTFSLPPTSRTPVRDSRAAFIQSPGPGQITQHASRCASAHRDKPRSAVSSSSSLGLQRPISSSAPASTLGGISSTPHTSVSARPGSIEERSGRGAVKKRRSNIASGNMQNL